MNKRLSVEVINPQHNDWYVKDLTECFKELISLYRENGYSKNNAILKNGEGLKLIKKLETITKKRLGFNIDIRLPNGYENCCIYTITSPNYNIHDKTAGEYYENLKEEIEGNENKYKDSDYMVFYNSYKSIEKAMNTKGVLIDNAKAHISNLPDAYVLIVFLDIYYLSIKMGMEADELAAVFLHEMGHGYTAIELSHRTMKNTTCILDAIADVVIKKNKSVKEAILYAYSNDLDIDISTLKDKNIVTVLYTGINETFKNVTGFGLSRRSYSDVEAVADQFAARFGVSESLVKALKKFDDKFSTEIILNNNNNIQSMNTIMWVIVSFITSIMTLVKGLTIAGSVTVGSMLSGPLVVFLLISMRVIALFMLEDDEHANVYDRLAQRMTRLRNDIVRQIRLYDIDKDIAKSVLNQYDSISGIIKNVPKEETPLDTKILRFFLKSYDNRVGAKEFEEVVEDLMENSLHISSLRFKTYK